MCQSPVTMIRKTPAGDVIAKSKRTRRGGAGRHRYKKSDSIGPVVVTNSRWAKDTIPNDSKNSMSQAKKKMHTNDAVTPWYEGRVINIVKNKFGFVAVPSIGEQSVFFHLTIFGEGPFPTAGQRVRVQLESDAESKSWYKDEIEGKKRVIKSMTFAPSREIRPQDAPRSLERRKLKLTPKDAFKQETKSIARGTATVVRYAAGPDGTNGFGARRLMIRTYTRSRDSYVKLEEHAPPELELSPTLSPSCLSPMLDGLTSEKLVDFNLDLH